MAARIIKNNEEFKKDAANYEVYSDFDHTFLPHPYTGQISRLKDVDCVKAALRNLILTNKYERLRDPEYGTRIPRFLFEPFFFVQPEELKLEIETAVEKYEPRVRLLDTVVEYQEEENRVYIKIEFSVRLSQETQTLDLNLYRVR